MERGDWRSCDIADSDISTIVVRAYHQLEVDGKRGPDTNIDAIVYGLKSGIALIAYWSRAGLC